MASMLVVEFCKVTIIRGDDGVQSFKFEPQSSPTILAVTVARLEAGQLQTRIDQALAHLEDYHCCDDIKAILEGERDAT